MSRTFNKATKMLLLSLMSILVVSVSAATYYSLIMTSTVAVYKSNVYFKAGSDNGIKGLVVTLGSQNTTVTLTGIRAYPNVTFTYTNPVIVRNNSTSGSPPSIRLAPSVNPSANAEDFEYVKFLLNATAVGDRRWLNYTSSGSTWSNPTATNWVSLPNDTEWSIVIITKALTAGVAGQSVTIGFTVDVD